MSVVLRCPTCGTTQAHPGECDACSDAEVRYFCRNHTAGVWLDGPLCGECGARFGETPAARLERAPRGAPTVPVHRTRRPGEIDTTTSVPLGSEPRSTIRRRRPPPPTTDIEEGPAAPSLSDLLAHLSREPEGAEYPVEEVRREPVTEIPRRPHVVVGCLRRLVLLVALLIALAIVGLFLLFGSAFS